MGTLISANAWSPSGTKVLLCGPCMDAQRLVLERVMEGEPRSTNDLLAAEALSAERELVI